MDNMAIVIYGCYNPDGSVIKFLHPLTVRHEIAVIYIYGYVYGYLDGVIIHIWGDFLTYNWSL